MAIRWSKKLICHVWYLICVASLSCLSKVDRSAANRLTSATGPWGTESFTYDATGNRLNDNVTSGSTTTRLAAYPTTSNRIVNLNQNAATFRTYAYDTGGNITTDTRPGETFVFTYNKRNRLSSLTRNAVAYATYGYNALEQMVTRTTSATGGPVGQVAYIYDLDGHLIAEATASTGATTRDYIWLAANDNAPTDMPLAVSDISGSTATLSYVHTDHLGRPIRMTDATKATVFQAIYKPYGEVNSTSGTKAQNLRFPGQYFQIETGFAYNWHRQYDPVTGRYTQPDPLRFVDGPSVYGYAKSNPSNITDRTGEVTIEGPGGGGRICIIIIGGFGLRLDCAPNPGPTDLHFHCGWVNGPDWPLHRPWYAPWLKY